jgi:hypothetical protein
MPPGFENSVIVLTGASSGMGRAAALLFWALRRGTERNGLQAPRVPGRES